MLIIIGHNDEHFNIVTDVFGQAKFMTINNGQTLLKYDEKIFHEIKRGRTS